jgi:hypothetical protein
MDAEDPAQAPGYGCPPYARWERLVIGVICFVFVGVFAWFASPKESLIGHADGDEAYYNLLVRGFSKGHLWMDAVPDPAFLASPNPYIPSLRRGNYLHDASLYGGHYYLYFGPTPALVLYGPFHWLTGGYLRDPQAVTLFVCAGFLIGVALLCGLRARYYPGLASGPLLAGIVAWGGCPLLFLLLRRPKVWEAAVACAFALLVAALFALERWVSKGRRPAWLAVASLAYAAAIVSRPTYLFGAVAFLIPLAVSVRDSRRQGFGTLVRSAAAVLLPACAVGVALLFYNHGRFGEWLNLGWRYQLTYNDESGVPHFGLAYLWENLGVYFTAAARLGGYLPFFYPVAFDGAPAGYQPFEDPYGLIPNVPFVVFALGAVPALAKRSGLRLWLSALVLVILGILPLLLCFFSASIRYMVDFTPGVVLLAIIGFWECRERCSGPVRVLTACVAALTLAWSIAFNMGAAVGHMGLFRSEAPEVYRALTRITSLPRAALDSLLRHADGPLEVTFRLAPYTGGRVEPLVVTGDDRASDYLYVVYEDPHHVTLGFEHTSHGGPHTRPLPIDYSVPHTVRVTMGSLYPPDGDITYVGVPQAETNRRLHLLEVDVDGRTELRAMTDFYPAATREPEVGFALPNQRAFGLRFSGSILSVRRLGVQGHAREDTAPVGALVLSLRWPEQPVAEPEPLLCAGVTGRADVLSVKYLDPRHVQFRLDHWGVGFLEGPVVEVEPAREQSLVISYGSLYLADRRPASVSEEAWTEASKRLVIMLDGRMVMNVPTSFYSYPPETVVVGHNPLGASSAGEAFEGLVSGWLWSAERVPLALEAKPRN